MARYASLQALKRRLENKVRFAEPGDNDPNKMTQDLFNSLVNEGESQIEIDLMMRYEVPFQPAAGGAFKDLPESTKTFLTTLSELIGVIRILETDFGRGTSANAEKYVTQLQKRYDGMIAQLVEIKKESYQTWLRPPLAGLKLAYSNQGDTGFRGRVIHSTTISHEADYAYKQINSPGESLFNSWMDPLDGPHNGR